MRKETAAAPSTTPSTAKSAVIRWPAPGLTTINTARSASRRSSRQVPEARFDPFGSASIPLLVRWRSAVSRFFEITPVGNRRLGDNAQIPDFVSQRANALSPASTSPEPETLVQKSRLESNGDIMVSTGDLA